MMRIVAWDSLFNFVFLLFWISIWNKDARRGAFNPYLGPVLRWARAVTAWLRPVAPGLGDRAVAALTLALLLVFRALLLMSNAETTIAFGLQAGHVAGTGFLDGVAVSLLSFGVFLFQLWGIAVIYVHSGRQASFSQTEETLEAFLQPLALVRVEWRPLALAAYGMALAFALEQVGFLPHQLAPPAGEVVPITLLRAFILALTGWAGILGLLQTALIVFIVGSWIAMFAGSPALHTASREWLDQVMGPLRRFPLQLGPLDLTPLVMIIGLGFLQQLLMFLLLRSYLQLI